MDTRAPSALTWAARGREVADAAYAQLVAAMCAQLERIAGADPKHGERLRLENYAFLADALRPLAAAVPVLGRYAARAGHARDVALAAYVRQQLEYGRFWRLLQLSQARWVPMSLLALPALLLSPPACLACWAVVAQAGVWACCWPAAALRQSLRPHYLSRDLNRSS